MISIDNYYINYILQDSNIQSYLPGKDEYIEPLSQLTADKNLYQPYSSAEEGDSTKVVTGCNMIEQSVDGLREDSGFAPSINVDWENGSCFGSITSPESLTRL
ncbi:hypothetical protein JTB14_034909 [Gonioctena quinquepunctata]|nr:hypothetical protein JTB14_034909 [Gonioctena quinquepunctata]